MIRASPPQQPAARDSSWDARARRGRMLATIARARTENAGLRIGVGVVVALAATSVLASPWPLAWLAGVLVVLAIDRRIHVRILKACEANSPPERLWPLLAWTAAQSAFANLMAAMLWSAKYLHGETLAVIFLFGGLANAAVTLRPSRALALSGAGPTIAFLLGLPLIDVARSGNVLDLMPLVAGLLALGFGLNLWRGLTASDEAQAQAENAALRERQAAAAAIAARADTIRRAKAELRTPLQALLGAAESMRRAALEPGTRLPFAALARASETVRAVLDDLSDNTWLENSVVKIEPAPTDLRDLAHSVIAAFRPAAQDKGLELFLDVAAETPPAVEIDPLRVRQVLSNLVANAIKYTKHGGVRVRLQVQAGDTQGHVRLGFVVADTGAGMSRSQLAMMLGAERPGFGGLAIAARLARQMGAKLAGKSELGEGSVFAFVIEAPIVAENARGRSAA